MSDTRIYTCSTCGESFANFGALGNHRKGHRGEAPRSNVPKIGRAPRRGVRIESMAGASADPSPEDAPAMPSDDGPRVMPAIVRITPEARAESTREAVAQALTVEVLADLLVSLSRALSEIDGAGEPGVLTRVQGAQVAVLLHDATVDLVISRFKGDVTRFKAAMAILLILLAKGAVHARAVQGKLAQRQAAKAATAALDAAAPEAESSPVAVPRFRGMSLDEQMRANAE